MISCKSCSLCDLPISDRQSFEDNGLGGYVHRDCLDSFRETYDIKLPYHVSVPAHTREGSTRADKGSTGRGRTQSRRGMVRYRETTSGLIHPAHQSPGDSG